MKAKELTSITVLIGIVELSSCLWPNCVQNPIDLAVVLDGSGSVGPTRFGLFKEFIQNLVLQLNVGEDGTKVALVQLSDVKETKFEFGINSYSDVSSILEAIENVKYQYGRLQNTEIALRMVESKVFSGENITDRPWAQNVLILIAEGPSTYPVQNVLREATHLKNRGVHVVTIGVGRRITSQEFQDELYSVASSQQDVFFTTDDDILALVDNLDTTLCPNVTTSTSVQSSSHTSTISATQIIPAKVETVLLVKTMTIWMTSHIPLEAICKTPIAAISSRFMKVTPATSTATRSKIPTVIAEKKKERKAKRKKNTTKFSGKLLECFTCNYGEDVAKEFAIDCGQQECARDEMYCADAVLEHAGRRFVRKRCATSQFCNSTSDQCVRDFKHTAEYTDCSIACCAESFCNPYSRASYLIVSVYMKYMSAVVVPLVVSGWPSSIHPCLRHRETVLS